MKRLKNIIAILCVALMFGESLTVNAAEQVNVISTNKNNAESYNFINLTEAQELPENVGESIKIGEDENGEIWVTLINESQSITRSTTLTNSHTYLFTYTNILGVVKDAYEVKLECDWVKAGENSYIIQLTGTYNVIASGFTCQWIDSSTSQCIHWLDLYVTQGSNSATLRFIASVFPLDGLDDLKFSCI